MPVCVCVCVMLTHVALRTVLLETERPTPVRVCAYACMCACCVSACIILSHVCICTHTHAYTAGERLGLLDVKTSPAYRNMQRVATWGPEVAAVVYQRIRPFIDDSIVVTADTTTVHQDFLGATHGRWEPQCINPAWRVCKYEAGGHFAPHHDGDHVVSAREKSLLTCMLYLNGGFQGGGTNFISADQGLYRDDQGRQCAEEKNILHRVQPEAGLCLLFHHRVMHEGAALLATDCCKYMMRTEVMYQNVEPEASAALDPADEEALRLVKQAEVLEETDPLAAAGCYRKAFKLSARVRDHYNS